ncbi:hypothetical protein EON65_03380 [archaeon]|nr:MAG: hypothetical protein EON65_03380 [archaeon]
MIISEVISDEKRKLHEIENVLLEMQRTRTGVGIEGTLDRLRHFQETLGQMEKLTEKEPKAKKDDYRRRIQHLRSTYAHLKSLAENIAMKYGDQKSLLFAGQDGRKNISQDDFELELAESGSLARSSQNINEYIAIGRETLSELVSQRERLKGIQRKAIDMLNYLGISGNMLKGVEKRDAVDKIIVFVGMAVILLVLLFIWWFVKK